MACISHIGIDLGGTKIEALALDSSGTVLSRRRVRTPAGDAPAIVRLIGELVRELEDEFGGPAHVGIATPGSLSPATGLLRNSNSICLNGLRLDKALEDVLNRPVRLANDADCFALSEATDGAGAGARTVFGVILGTGVGGGVVIDGQLLAGRNGIAGEWGHNPLPWPRDDERPGRKCYCGWAGCIETFLSGPALAADHAEHGGEPLAAMTIAAAAAEGDETARTSLDRYADRLARALASVINLLDPETIVLGGGLSNIALLYRKVPELWSRYVFSDVVETRLERTMGYANDPYYRPRFGRPSLAVRMRHERGGTRSAAAHR
jgi:fructokinase